MFFYSPPAYPGEAGYGGASLTRRTAAHDTPPSFSAINAFPSAIKLRGSSKVAQRTAAVGAGQPHIEFRLGWSGLTARAAESMGARLVIDELTVASRRPVVCTLQLPEVSAAAEGQERDLEEGFTDPQRRPQGDQGAGSM